MAIIQPTRTFTRSAGTSVVKYIRFDDVASADATKRINCIGAKYVHACVVRTPANPTATTAIVARAFIENRVTVTGLTWTESSKTITAGTGVFTEYVATIGEDEFHLHSDRETIAGAYSVASKVNTTQITLDQSISRAGVDLTVPFEGELIGWETYFLTADTVSRAVRAGSVSLGAPGSTTQALVILDPPPFITVGFVDATAIMDIQVELHY